MGRVALLAGGVALAAIAAGSARWPIAPERFAAGLNSGFGPSRAWSWKAPEAATFSALPWPAFRLVEARLEDASAANRVSAAEARVDLSLTDLVFGRLAPRQVTLDQPTITLDLDRPPFDSGFGELDVFRVLPPLPRVSLTNGVIRVVSRKRGFDTMLASVQGRLEGLFIGARMSVDLSAVWRNVPLTLSGSLEEPQRAAVGGQSPLALGIASPLGDLKFDGALTAGATPTAAGD
ncbi:MAG TPA: hypothetical protein VEH77_08655, partial [Roseiarcus sp.]|nr:hypothetical protein [Roseiarcus sp.]